MTEPTRLEWLEHWIDIAGGISCPNCGNVGYTVYALPDGEPAMEQCEFCYVCEDSVFNRLKTSGKEEGDS